MEYCNNIYDCLKEIDGCMRQIKKIKSFTERERYEILREDYWYKRLNEILLGLTNVTEGLVMICRELDNRLKRIEDEQDRQNK